MYRLTATYKIEFPNRLRVKRAEDDPLCYTAVIEGFDTEVVLVRNGGASIKEKGEIHETRAVTRIDVSISRDDDSAPPDVPVNEKGGRDFTDRAPWFGEREHEYRRVAVEAVNRVIRFFKYEMNTPRLREFSVHDAEFRNPQWTNRNGKELQSGILELTSTVLSPPGPGLLGEKDFTEDEDAKLGRALQNDLDIETHRDFLSDAQTSILHDKLRRAILEMAIACEVAVKGAFFAKATAAGAAYEYLEDKRRVRVKVIELIDGAAKLAFGQSFKDVDPDAYMHIDFLFRARNRVAHRGERTYRDDVGTECQVDRPTLEAWRASVDTLMKWIAKHRV